MDDALEYLVELVESGVDFPDAEYKAAVLYHLDDAELSDLRRRYDEKYS